MKTSDSNMKYLHNSKPEFIICGDMKTDYFNVNYHKKLLVKPLYKNETELVRGIMRLFHYYLFLIKYSKRLCTRG